MTIPADNYEPTKTLGNGATVDFSFPWNMIDEDYSRVYLEDVVTGVQTLQTLGSVYTLVFTDSGGTVTFLTAPTSDYYVIVSRDIAKTQETSYSTSSGFQGVTTENDFDKVVSITQDLTEASDRTLQFPLGTDTGVISSVLPTPEAGLLLGWNGTATALVNTTITTGEALPAVANTYLKRNAGNTAFGTDIQPTTNATNIATNTANIKYQIGYINGGVISNDAVTPDSLIDITASESRSDDNTKDIDVAADTNFDITTNGNWASGTAPSLTNASIHLWAVWDATTPYYIFDDATGSNITPVKRRVGSFITDATDDIIPFTAYELSGGGVDVVYVDEIVDRSSALAIGSENLSVSVPDGISISLSSVVALTRTAAGDGFGYMSEYGKTLQYFVGGVGINTQRSAVSPKPIYTSNATVTIEVTSNDLTTYQVRINGYTDGRIT